MRAPAARSARTWSAEPAAKQPLAHGHGDDRVVEAGEPAQAGRRDVSLFGGHRRIKRLCDGSVVSRDSPVAPSSAFWPGALDRRSGELASSFARRSRGGFRRAPKPVGVVPGSASPLLLVYGEDRDAVGRGASPASLQRWTTEAPLPGPRPKVVSPRGRPAGATGPRPPPSGGGRVARASLAWLRPAAHRSALYPLPRARTRRSSTTTGRPKADVALVHGTVGELRAGGTTPAFVRSPVPGVDSAARPDQCGACGSFVPPRGPSSM